MYSNYGAIMSCVFVTFFYGYALPLLFPIAAFTFMNYYITEKLLVTYWFQQPPMYDEKLNKSALNMLKWAPVFFLFFGYWAFGNKQIYQNAVYPIIYSYAPVNTGHSGLPSYMGPDIPVFIVACLYTFAIIFETLWNRCLVKCKVSKEEEVENEEVDEQLGSYWQALPSSFRKKWFVDEIYNANKLDIRTIGDYSIEKMRTY